MPNSKLVEVTLKFDGKHNLTVGGKPCADGEKVSVAPSMAEFLHARGFTTKAPKTGSSAKPEA